jgi:hypothetical protein
MLREKKKSIPALIILFIISVFFLNYIVEHHTSSQKYHSVVISPSPSIVASPSPSELASASPSASPSPTPKLITPANLKAPLFNGSVFTRRIPDTATYTKEDRIGTLRPSLESYSMPIYRIKEDVPLVKIINNYGGRTENWPIPSNAKTSTGEDRTLAVFDQAHQMIYEMWDAKWQSDGSIHAGGMKNFAMNGDGLSHPRNQRVTASGFAGVAGMIIREDGTSINHALNISIPHQLIKKDSYISPAINGESAGDNTGDIPLGTHLALPKSLNVDELNVHPFTKALARSLRDYGAYVSDRNNAGQYQGKYIATVKVEPGVTQTLYKSSNDALNPTIQKQMYDIFQKYGLYRVN